MKMTSSEIISRLERIVFSIREPKTKWPMIAVTMDSEAARRAASDIACLRAALAAISISSKDADSLRRMALEALEKTE
jgi:uncharacterized protein YfeS